MLQFKCVWFNITLDLLAEVWLKNIRHLKYISSKLRSEEALCVHLLGRPKIEKQLACRASICVGFPSLTQLHHFPVNQVLKNKAQDIFFEYKDDKACLV